MADHRLEVVDDGLGELLGRGKAAHIPVVIYDGTIGGQAQDATRNRQHGAADSRR